MKRRKSRKIGEAYKVSTASGLTIDTDYVLDATGRNPNVEGIGLDQVGIEYSKKGISVDGHLRTNVSNIYASGDVLDKDIPKLTPTATFESNYIAAHILGMTQDEIQYQRFLQYCTRYHVFLKLVLVFRAEQSERYTVKHIPFGKQMVFEYKNETDAEMYAVLDEEKRLVGADIYGVDALI